MRTRALCPLLFLLGACSGAPTGPDGGHSPADARGAPADARAPTDAREAPPDLTGVTCQGTETFQDAYAALFAIGGCKGFAQFSCHGKPVFGNGLDLSSAAIAYQDLVNVMAVGANKLRVKPGDPGESFLMQKLTNTQAANEGGPMPQPVEGIMWHPPDPTKLNIIRCWIVNGALNN